jgi:hypothetical protein
VREQVSRLTEMCSTTDGATAVQLPGLQMATSLSGLQCSPRSLQHGISRTDKLHRHMHSVFYQGHIAAFNMMVHPIDSSHYLPNLE